MRPARFSDWPGERTLRYRSVAGSLEVYDVLDFEGFYGGSNICFSARDLAAWSESFYESPVLDDTMLGIGLALVFLDRGQQSGLNLLGWYHSADAQRFYFTGHWRGFYSVAYRDIGKKYSIAYVSNNNMPYWLRPALVAALIDAVEGEAR